MTFLSFFYIDIGDRKIEVIGLESCLHMGQVRTGLRASGLCTQHNLLCTQNVMISSLSSSLVSSHLGRRLAQCSEIILKTKKTFPMQIDGEPWMQEPATVSISHVSERKKTL